MRAVKQPPNDSAAQFPSDAAGSYLTSPAVVLAAAVLLYISITGTVPLTYDEAWNFTNLSSRSPSYALLNYPAPNNHVLFTFLQSLLLPNRLVSYWPPFLRLPNLLYGWALFIVLGKILSACSIGKQTAHFGVALLMISPITALYLVVARGYLLGLLLVLAAVLAYLHKRLNVATLCLILATYTVPTFGYIYPALVICAELDDATSWPRRVLRVSVRSAIFVAAVATLYLPVLDSLSKSSNGTFAYSQTGVFGADVARLASFITMPVAIRQIWLLPLCTVLIYGRIAWKGRAMKRGMAHRLAQFAALAGLFSLLIPTILHAIGLSALPFVRNLIAIPFLLGLGIFVAAENGLLFSSQLFRAGVRAVFAANFALTAAVFLMCFIIRSPLDYPTFAGLNPTPIEDAVKRGVPMRGALISAPWFYEPVLALYGNAGGYNFRRIDEDAPVADLPCVSGTIPPASGIKIESSVVTGRLCY
jgi:hypothetical protein